MAGMNYTETSGMHVKTVRASATGLSMQEYTGAVFF
jgi:hypothetical protein